MQRRFARALLIGCPDPAGPSASACSQEASMCAIRARCSLQAAAAPRSSRMPGRRRPSAYDLVVAVGTLDTVNDLPLRAAG